MRLGETMWSVSRKWVSVVVCVVEGGGGSVRNFAGTTNTHCTNTWQLILTHATRTHSMVTASHHTTHTNTFPVRSCHQRFTSQSTFLVITIGKLNCFFVKALYTLLYHLLRMYHWCYCSLCDPQFRSWLRCLSFFCNSNMVICHISIDSYFCESHDQGTSFFFPRSKE